MSTMIATRDAYGEVLAELGAENTDVVVLDADLSGSTKTSVFAKKFPERFFNMGIAEANMVGTAAGLAAAGKIPFVSTFAIFAVGRAWEQMRQSVAYPKANVKIVEVPPGPPVMAPIVAEVYGLDHAQQAQTALDVASAFRKTSGIVDVDTTLEAPQQKWLLAVDQARAARLGVDQAQVVEAIAMAEQGSDLSFLHDPNAKYPVPIRTEFSAGDKADIVTLRALRVRARGGALVPLADVTQLVRTTRDQTLYHKDLLPVVYVTGDMAGDTDSPLYGMAGISSRVGEMKLGDGQPADRVAALETIRRETPVRASERIFLRSRRPFPLARPNAESEAARAKAVSPRLGSRWRNRRGPSPGTMARAKRPPSNQAASG